MIRPFERAFHVATKKWEPAVALQDLNIITCAQYSGELGQ
jgi:hypothetical protein